MNFWKKLIISVYILFLIYHIYLQIKFKQYIKLIEAVASILILFGPIILNKVFKTKLKEQVKVIYYLFFLLAFIIGFVFGFYYKTLYYDLLVHFLSGFLASIVLNEYLNLPKKALKKIIIFSVVLSLSACWELLEFASDIILKTDHQHKISGATDTMSDLLMCVLGIIFYFIINKIKRLFSNKQKHIIKT